MRNYYPLINSMGSGTIHSTLNTGLYAVYNAENNTNDSFGSNNGTAQGGLTYATGKINDAFVGNGTNAFVSLPNDSFNSLTGDFTVSFWVYFTSLSGIQTIFSNTDYDGSNRWGFNITAVNNSLRFTLSDGTATPILLDILAGQAMITNTWYHYVVTRKSSTRSRIYRDNTLLVSDTNTTNPVYNSGDMRPAICALSYGAAFSNLKTYYLSSGSKVDAMNIWNKELTATEITELYNSGNGKQYPY